MKRNIIIFVLLICIVLAACGGNGSVSQNIISSKDASSISVEPSAQVDITSSPNSITDLNKQYSVKDEVLNAGPDDPVIQIGNNVLHIGKATVRDFVNCGLVLFYDDMKIESALKEPVKKALPTLYLKDSTKKYGIEISFIMSSYGSGVNAGDCIVEEIQVVPWDTRGANYNIYNNPSIVGSYHCIYFSGGVRFGGSFEEAFSAYGTPKSDKTMENMQNTGVAARLVEFNNGVSVNGAHDIISNYLFSKK